MRNIASKDFLEVEKPLIDLENFQAKENLKVPSRYVGAVPKSKSPPKRFEDLPDELNNQKNLQLKQQEQKQIEGTQNIVDKKSQQPKNDPDDWEQSIATDDVHEYLILDRVVDALKKVFKAKFYINSENSNPKSISPIFGQRNFFFKRAFAAEPALKANPDSASEHEKTPMELSKEWEALPNSVPIENIPFLGVLPNTDYYRRKLLNEERFYDKFYETANDEHWSFFKWRKVYWTLVALPSFYYIGKTEYKKYKKRNGIT